MSRTSGPGANDSCVAESRPGDAKTARLMLRQERISARLAIYRITQQQMLAQAADISASIQEAEQLAPQAISDHQPSLARELSRRLEALDGTLCEIHAAAATLDRKIQIYLALQSRQELRLGWHAQRDKCSRPMGSLQRSSTTTLSSRYRHLPEPRKSPQASTRSGGESSAP